METHYEKNVISKAADFTVEQLKRQQQALMEIPKALNELEKRLRKSNSIYITGNEPCAADYVLFHEVVDLNLINFRIKPKSYPQILRWFKACEGLRGNKEVYNLYNT